MPRTSRASVGDICYHVINRGNGRATVFHKPADYDRFTEMMIDASRRLPMRTVGWCLMPTHFHLVLWPFNDGDLGRWMHWLMTCHVRRYHTHYHTSGHIWQGRFKAFPIQQDSHYLTVLRYVEYNPVRASLVKRAEDWPWSSLCAWEHHLPHPLLSNGPVDRPLDWRELVNQKPSDDELAPIRNCVNRGAPFGDQTWLKRTTAALALGYTLNPPGRPPGKRGHS
jgi:putative transposase